MLLPICDYSIKCDYLPALYIDPHASVIQFSYSDSDGNPVHVVQLTFLKLLSATAKQSFTYTCQNSAGWFNRATRSYQHALRFRGSNDEEMTQAKSPFIQSLHDGCQVSARSGPKGRDPLAKRELAVMKLMCLSILLLSSAGA